MAWIGVITNGGAELLDQWALGGEMAITSAATGAGTVSELAMTSQTALVSQKQTASIISQDKLETGLRIKLQITAPATGYTLNQFGVWASLDEETPVLLALYQNGDGVTIPSFTEAPDFVYSLYALLKISNDGDLTVNIDTSALVSQSTLEEFLNDKYDKTGGTLTGNVTVVQDGAIAPGLRLQGPEKAGVGRATGSVVKNASAETDYGTHLIDTSWGGGDQLRLVVRLAASTLKEKLTLLSRPANGPDTTYYIYGTHNPPAVADVTGLQAALDAGTGALNNHKNDTSNPHSVTKTQVGLGNVPNVATNDQTPTYSEAGSLTALSSGEKLSVAFGKLKKAVATLISHLADTGNPHSVTKTQVGLGNVPNVATNDQTPTYTAASSNTALSSGEKLSVAFGKIAKAISSLISHLADTTSHITASERTTWNGKQNALTFDNSPTSGSANPVKSGGVYTALADKYDKAGGTVSGNVNIQRSDSGMSSVMLISAEKENVGRARTILQKNASATTDSGTLLMDFSWGYSSTTHPHLRMHLKAAATTLKELLYLYYKPESGSAVTYYLYGTHNPPAIADVTGLQTDFYVVSGKKSGTTLGTYATAEGNNNTASGEASHTEGVNNTASSYGSHAEGRDNIASGSQAHAEGIGTTASGASSHAEGGYTIAQEAYQHVFGKYNIADSANVEIVGWGTSSTRKNIRTLGATGNEWIAGTLTQSSDARLKDVQGDIPDVSGVRAVRFRWNDAKGEHDGLDHIGYLAQDVEAVAPFLVGEDSQGYKSLDYIAFLCAKVELLERRVAELENR